MKKGLIALCFMAASGAASSQSDFALTISVPDGLNTGVHIFREIRLDINLESRFLSANGIIITDSGYAVPATGSCFFTAMDGVLCNVQVDQSSYTMDIASNFVGMLYVKEADGSTSVETRVEITSLD